MKPYKFLLIFLLCSCTKTYEAKEDSISIIEVPIPTELNASLPHLIRGANDKLYISWVENGDSNQTNLKYAELIEGKWSSPDVIATGSNWFVNWADFPMLAVDALGNKIAHYLVKSSSETYAYDVHVVSKPDTANSWSDPIIPHRDGTQTEHGFVTMLPNNDGTFLLAWLDGRNAIPDNHNHGVGGAMTLRSAIIDLAGELSNEIELDNRVCDCCQTGGVVTAEGSTIVYRDRSVDEVRDMAYVSGSDSSWSAPTLVATDDWKIEGCPVNGPRVAAFENTISVAWYTGALGRSAVKVAFKKDREFGDPIIVDNSAALGRVDIAMLDKETALVSWLDGGDTPSIKCRSVSITGQMSPTRTVAEMSESRASGFPQMEVLNGAVYFAWTQVIDGNTLIKIVKSGL